MECSSLIYLNKVFSNTHATSCPLMVGFEGTPATFTEKLSFFDSCSDNNCGDSCSNCCSRCCSCNCGSFAEGISSDTVFEVKEVKVSFEDFDTAPASPLSAANVTVDGIAVDSLNNVNERYVATTKELLSQIGDCKCMAKGISTRGYFMVRNAGPWTTYLKIVAEGTASSCGLTRNFRLCMSSIDKVTITGSNTFVIANMLLPCTVDGISPLINFNFDATGTILTPELTVMDDETNQCALRLRGSLISDPVINVEVTRETLFNTSASEVKLPCDDLDGCDCENAEDCVNSCDRTCTEGRIGGHSNIVKDICCQYLNGNGCNHI